MARKNIAKQYGADKNHILFQTQPSVGSPRKAYAETAEGFVDLIKDKHSQYQRVAWHSIVGEGTACGTRVLGGEYSEVKEYKKLSQLTGGMTQNLCSVNYESFMGALSTKVNTGVIRKYAVPEEIAQKIVKVRVKNLSGETKEFLLGQEFTVDENFIRFSPTLPLNVGEQIEVVYRVE